MSHSSEMESPEQTWHVIRALGLGKKRRNFSSDDYRQLSCLWKEKKKTKLLILSTFQVLTVE